MSAPPPAAADLAVYRGLLLVLTVQGRPGVLLSTAAPPPSGAPRHPFVGARAYDPYSEGELRVVLDGSGSFDEFLTHLVAAGFDVVAVDGSPPAALDRAARVRHGRDVVGFVADHPGTFLDLARPSVRGGPLSCAGTAYGPEGRAVVSAALTAAGSFDEVTGRLRSEGLQVDVEAG